MATIFTTIALILIGFTAYCDLKKRIEQLEMDNAKLKGRQNELIEALYDHRKVKTETRTPAGRGQGQKRAKGVR